MVYLFHFRTLSMSKSKTWFRVLSEAKVSDSQGWTFRHSTRSISPNMREVKLRHTIKVKHYSLLRETACFPISTGKRNTSFTPKNPPRTVRDAALPKSESGEIPSLQPLDSHDLSTAATPFPGQQRDPPYGICC